jgi:tRNA C32,U32 (ribose-2'-O)-methylase TrmJ
MKNMGFGDLVLVAPRYFPHEEATARASGAQRAITRHRMADPGTESLRGATDGGAGKGQGRRGDGPGEDRAQQ